MSTRGRKKTNCFHSARFVHAAPAPRIFLVLLIASILFFLSGACSQPEVKIKVATSIPQSRLPKKRQALSRAEASESEIPLPQPGQRVLVIAPHEDDEAIAGFAFLKHAIANKAQVKLVMMTNGDAAAEAALLAQKLGRKLDHDVYLALGCERQAETMAVARLMGIPESSIYFLGYPDAGLAKMLLDHWEATNCYVSATTGVDHSVYKNSFRQNAPYCAAPVLDDLTTIIETYRPDIILLPHPMDEHPDHWASNALASLAVNRLGLDYRKRVAMYAYLVHHQGYPLPSGFHPDKGLYPPISLLGQNTKWEIFRLKKQDEIEKSAALAMYKSQSRMDAAPLEKFVRQNELFAKINDPELIIPAAEDERPASVHLLAKAPTPLDQRRFSSTGDPSQRPQGQRTALRLPSLGLPRHGLTSKTPRITGLGLSATRTELIIDITVAGNLPEHLVYRLQVFTFGEDTSYKRLEIRIREGSGQVDLYGFPLGASILTEKTNDHLRIYIPFNLLGYPRLMSLGAYLQDENSDRQIVDRAPFSTIQLLYELRMCSASVGE